MTSGPPPDAAPGASAARSPRPTVPTTVVAASVLAALEGLAVLGYAVVYTAQVLPLESDVLTRALIAGGVVLFLLMVATGLVAAARALLRLQHWPRSLLVVVQLIVLAVVLPLALDGLLAAWLAVLGAVALVAVVLAPATTAAIER